MERVTVSKGLLVGLSVLSGLSLLTLAFVLGRTSGSVPPSALASVRPAGGDGQRAAAVPFRSEPPAVDLPPLVPIPAAPPSSERSGALAASGVVSSGPGARLGSEAPLGLAASLGPAAAAAAAPGRGGSARDPESTAVVAYLAAVDNVQPGKLGDSPASVANEMAAALAQGDTSCLDRLIAQTERAKEQLAALSPPAPCTAHHAASLRSLDDGLELLRAMKKAMESPDPAAGFAAVASRAGALRSRAEELQREEEALRQRYGLAR